MTETRNTAPLAILAVALLAGCGDEAESNQAESNQAEPNAVAAAAFVQVGEAETPGVGFSAQLLDFGQVSEGTTAKVDLVVANQSQDPMSIVSAASDCGCISVIGQPAAGDEFLPGESRSLTVQAKPTFGSAGVDRKHVRVTIEQNGHVTVYSVPTEVEVIAGSFRLIPEVGSAPRGKSMIVVTVIGDPEIVNALPETIRWDKGHAVASSGQPVAAEDAAVRMINIDVEGMPSGYHTVKVGPFDYTLLR